MPLTPDHGYPMLVAIASAVAIQYAGFKVGAARRKYNVKYPTMYLPESDKNAMAFNCVQRGHQNLLENWNRFLILLTIASINYPRLAALGGLLRVIAMVVYCNEYGKGKPENRRKAAFGYIGTLLNLGLSIMTVGGLIMQSM